MLDMVKYSMDVMVQMGKVQNMKQTHCAELMKLFMNNADVICDTCHYTADGLYAVIKDFDGQEYEVEIKPKRS